MLGINLHFGKMHTQQMPITQQQKPHRVGMTKNNGNTSFSTPNKKGDPKIAFLTGTPLMSKKLRLGTLFQNGNGG
ncbi:hypothetical protein [Cellvibrio japonicus]|uniref:hypothetical protein n=1 Tax=Cellvibrio japonicus TaxID=155077 RepID=UPI0011D13EA2|nr:hypothetical protein [Cellvibrio japonicus]QEI10948.1 hypothetical protein FY117_01025 [Cellvibrio japonicus]QEI14524.1 hypothetical protein FY116_01025 [Cellvibrio japonicus]QEI18102.1 hypothetical protein FY115_01025 [Cellvibrio japonicus]